MNRSVRARESQMHAVSRQRQQSGSLRTSMKKEKEDDLALFLDMRKREKERNNLLFQNSEELGVSGSKPLNASTFSTSASTPQRRTGVDDFFNSDNDKNDYDWLLTPPGTPLFPSLEMETKKTTMSQICTPKARPSSVLKSRLSAGSHDHPPRNNMLPRPSVSSPGSLSSTTVPRKPLQSKTATSALRPTPATTARQPRSTTPTPRPTSSHSKPPDPPRSSTPTRHTVRSSTPTSRPPPRSSTPTPKSSSTKPTRPTSRAATPSRISPAVSSAPAAAIKTARNPTPVRGISPSPKSRPWKPSEMPGFSLEAPPNLRTSLADRPQSAARGRAGTPSSRAGAEGTPGGRPRRQSCSPSRGRPTNTAAHNNRSSVPAMSRPHFKANDAVNPVVMGTKMVERVINMRRLVPSKLDEKASPISGKSSSSPDTGFGRMLSKKSLDMAIRHMDIGRRTAPGNLRPLMTNIPASSMYSVRSGPARSRTVSMSDSPLATSSNASSEVSVNNCGFFFEEVRPGRALE